MKPFGYPTTRLTLLSREVLVIALAAAGGGAFALLGMPAAWLSGSMLLSAVVALLRPLPSLRRPWFDATMVLSGTILGSAATPEALTAAARYPASLLVLLVGVAVIMAATGAYLRHVARWPWIDALLAAAPGALSTVLAVAQAKGANIGRISVVQLFRLLVLVALLPSVMQLSGASAGTPAPPVETVDAATMLGVTMAGLALGLVFEARGLAEDTRLAGERVIAQHPVVGDVRPDQGVVRREPGGSFRPARARPQPLDPRRTGNDAVEPRIEDRNSRAFELAEHAIPP